MNGLLPIIRRVRRPLLPVDWAADAKPVVVAVKVQSAPTAAVPTENPVDSRGGRQVVSNKIGDAKSSSAVEA
jgi:hypothetical protein